MRTEKQIKSSIDAVVKTAATLQASIHALAVECLEHAAEHGDARCLDYLMKTLPKGQRVDSLRRWVLMFSPIRWTSNDITKQIGLLKTTAKNYVPFDIDSAKATPYWELEEAPTPKKLTLDQIVKILAGIEGRITRAEEADLIDGDKAAIKAAGRAASELAVRLQTVKVAVADTEVKPVKQAVAAA